MSGIPTWLRSTCSFEPGLPRPVGFGPVASPPFFGSHRRRVHHDARPVDQTLSAQLVRHGPMQSSPDPGRIHTVKHRCAVGTLTLNWSGSIRHAQPLVSTYTTAVNTARWSTGVVPPPCGRG